MFSVKNLQNQKENEIPISKLNKKGSRKYQLQNLPISLTYDMIIDLNIGEWVGVLGNQILNILNQILKIFP